MKILLVGKYYAPSKGGIETVLRSLAEGLQASGDQVTVLCSDDPSAPALEPAAANDAQLGNCVQGIRVVRARTYGTLASQPLSPALLGKLRSLASSHELIHLHSPNPLAELAMLAVAGSKPWVITHHSDVVRQKLLLPAYAPLYRKALARASAVTVATSRQIARSPFLPDVREKCEAIPFGIDPIAYEATPAIQARARALSEKYGRFALFVGRLVGYKGLPVLLEALARAQTATNAVIVGTGPLRQTLETRARELGLGTRVHFAGSVPDAELAAYFHASEMLILPSITPAEAFGMVQLEAMACGKPVIASRLDSGITEVNEEGVSALFVAPGDASELARAMDTLFTDEARRRSMGEAAHARFQARFTRQRMIDSYRALYARIISS